MLTTILIGALALAALILAIINISSRKVFGYLDAAIILLSLAILIPIINRV